MIPSDQSDFNLYGGIYRYLNLVYVLQLSIGKMFALAEVDGEGKRGTVQISARFHNPLQQSRALVSVRLLDPSGRLLKETKKEISDLEGKINISEIPVKAPQLWSTGRWR